MIIDDTIFSYKLDTNFKKYIVKSMTYNFVSIEWEQSKPRKINDLQGLQSVKLSKKLVKYGHMSNI